MTDGIIERVTRTLLREQLGLMGHPRGASLEAAIDAEWPAFARVVRSALAAMRDPTEAMIRGTTPGFGTLAVGGRVKPPVDPAQAWPAMIDAVLAEPGPEPIQRS